jgi:hypothetical protein
LKKDFLKVKLPDQIGMNTAGFPSDWTSQSIWSD